MRWPALLRLALQGDRGGFRLCLKPELQAWLHADLQWSWHMAGLWALLGEAEPAIDWLGNAVDREFRIAVERGEGAEPILSSFLRGNLEMICRSPIQ